MAYTEQRTDSSGRTGHIGRFRIDGRLRSTRRFTAKREALAEAHRQEEAGKRSEWIDPSASRTTLTAWFTTWQKGRIDRAPRTTEAENERFHTLIAPTFGNKPLRHITHEDITHWAATMRSPTTNTTASPARRRDAVRLLAALLDAAVDARRLRTNPARTPSGKVPALPRAPKTKPHRYLTHEQLRRVADAAGPPCSPGRTLILLTALTGLRWGEVSALTIADIDPLRRRIHITKAYTRLDNGTLLLSDTKTHARRQVPLPHAVAHDLTTIIGTQPPTALLFPSNNGTPLRRESFDRSTFRPAVHAAGNAITTLSTLLDERITHTTYNPTLTTSVRQFQKTHNLTPHGISDPSTWTALAEADRERRAELTRGQKVSRTRLLASLSRTTVAPGAEDFDTLTLHDLRHTAASLAISGGASVKAVQHMLGHESPMLTLSTYAGLFEDDLDRLGDSMSEAFSASGDLQRVIR